MHIYATNFEHEEDTVFKSKIKRNAMGDILLDPDGEDYAIAAGKEWANVQFSLSFPLSDDNYRDAQGLPGINNFWPAPASMDEGRYKGVFRIRTRERKRENYSYAAMAFYNSEERRFGSDIAQALGGSDFENNPNVDTKVWHAPLPVYKKCKCEGHSDNCDTRLRYYFQSENEESDGGGLELVSFELLQFRDGISLTNPIHRFLVIHFVAMNCTSEQIQSISRALTKPRNKLYISPDCSVKLLKETASFIEAELNKVDEGEYDVHFAKGGYIAPRVVDTHGEVAQARSKNFVKAQPARSVCAIPNVPIGEISDLPDVFSDQKTDIISPDIAMRAWGAQLAHGFDNSSAEIPTVDALGVNLQPDRELQNWHLLASSNGIVSIRKTPILDEDLSAWSLAATRHVDLLLLVQRSYMVLRGLSKSMREIKTLPPVKAVDSDSLEKRKKYRDLLKQQFEQLIVVQNGFAELRNTLWFNAIPRRSLDTYLFLGIRREMGVDGLYDDLVDEVRFRHRIHDLTYHEYDAEIREIETDEQENKEREFNLLIAVLALAVSVPAYIALVGEYSFGLSGIITAISGLLASVFICLGFLAYQNRSRKKRKLNRNK